MLLTKHSNINWLENYSQMILACGFKPLRICKILDLANWSFGSDSGKVQVTQILFEFGFGSGWVDRIRFRLGLSSVWVNFWWTKFGSDLISDQLKFGSRELSSEAHLDRFGYGSGQNKFWSVLVMGLDQCWVG